LFFYTNVSAGISKYFANGFMDCAASLPHRQLDDNVNCCFHSPTDLNGDNNGRLFRGADCKDSDFGRADDGDEVFHLAYSYIGRGECRTIYIIGFNFARTRTSSNSHFRWENVTHKHIDLLCAKTGLECNGFDDAPGLVNPKGGNFSLLATSPNVDRAVRIPGINDRFHGSAPDVGAFEFFLP